MEQEHPNPVCVYFVSDIGANVRRVELRETLQDLPRLRELSLSAKRYSA
jgi:hypothetical protein